MRFVTRELDKVFKQLIETAEEKHVSIHLSTSRWNHHQITSNLKTEAPIDVAISLVQIGPKPVKAFKIEDYSSLEAMVTEVLHAIENWGGDV